MNKSKTQEPRGLKTVSEAKALSCKVPSMRPRRGIVGDQTWKCLVHAARNQSGRTGRAAPELGGCQLKRKLCQRDPGTV